MKIKNTPSSEFYTEMYKKLDELIKSIKLLANTNITIKNYVADKEYIKPDNIEIGYMTYKMKQGKLQYKIRLAELSSIEFGNSDYTKLSQMRYSVYLDSLGIPLSPEVLTLLTLLHEVGHIDFWQNYIEITESEESGGISIASYDRVISSLYAMVMKPWEFGYFYDMNMNHIMFNSVETAAELFALKYFPCFIELLKAHNLC